MRRKKQFASMFSDTQIMPPLDLENRLKINDIPSFGGDVEKDVEKYDVEKNGGDTGLSLT